jgi:two-component system, NtrC family, sensor histidine kinase KinB
MQEDTFRSSLELLYNVSRELASALDLRMVLQRILFQSLKLVGGERGSIVVLDDNGKAVDAAIVFGMQVHEHTTTLLRETMERGLAGWVVRNRQPAWVPDTSKDERWLRRPDDAAERSGAKSALCVPLVTRERLVGVLTLVHPVPQTYTKDHFDLMQAIADQAGIAVLNARLYTESQRQARVMTALAASAETITGSLQLEELLPRILNETIQAMQVDTVALALVDSGGNLVFHAATGESSESITGKRVPAGKGVAGWVVRAGEAVAVPDVNEDERFQAEDEQFARLEVKSLACAPIHAQGRVIGVLEAINPIAGMFDADAQMVLAGIADLAGSSIQNAQLFERLQAAHKRYRELFDDSIDPILLTDWYGKILEANRQAAALSGHASKQLHEMSVSDLSVKGWREQGISEQELQAGETCTYESVLRSKSRINIPVEVHVRRVVFEDTDSLQWTLRDITERKDLDDLRDDLTAMIYHDLRSPLANIVSSLDVLATIFNGNDNAGAKSVLSIAMRSTDRIQRLVNSLLDINRLESGQAIVSQQAASPVSLAGEAIEAAHPMIENRRQFMKTNFQGKLPPIWVDEDMIRRVLINLLENASKFTPQEGKIEIGAAADGSWVKLWVQDNGPGIPTSEQERIFDKFTRLKGENTTSGLGVGLAFCRLAVSGHGGRIWVESQPGQGSKFIMTLPVVNS